MNIAIIGKSKGLPHFTKKIQNSDLRIFNNPNGIILGFPGGGISIAAKIEDPIFNSAKAMFMRYAKEQHKPISNIAKQELENIKNNTDSVCEDNNLKEFRMFPKKVQIAVLVKIMTENLSRCKDDMQR